MVQGSGEESGQRKLLEAEELGIRIIATEGSCATAPRWNLGSWKPDCFFSVLFLRGPTHTLGEQRTVGHTS